MKRVHGLHHGNVRQHQFEFVGLEMAYEMPLDIGGHLRRLGRKLLRAVLSKEPLSGIVGLHEAFYRMEFGHSYQADTGGQRITKGMKGLCYHCKARERPTAEPQGVAAA